MSDLNEFLREVNEDLRQERLENMWKKYRTPLVGGVISIVLCTVIWVSWRTYETNGRVRASQAYEQALTFLNSGSASQGLDHLSALMEKTGPYRGLAGLKKANVLILDASRKEEALAIYSRIAKDTRCTPAVRYLAGYYAVLHQMDTADPEALLADLTALKVGANPWRLLAEELEAGLTLKAGRAREAVGMYQKLLGGGVPPFMQTRLQAALNKAQNTTENA